MRPAFATGNKHSANDVSCLFPVANGTLFMQKVLGSMIRIRVTSLY